MVPLLLALLVVSAVWVLGQENKEASLEFGAKVEALVSLVERPFDSFLALTLRGQFAGVRWFEIA